MWLTLPESRHCTSSPEQVAESSPTSCSDTSPLAQSKSKHIPERFCCKGKLTDAYLNFLFGTTLPHSDPTTQTPQTTSSDFEVSVTNSPSAADFHARTFPVPERAQASPAQSPAYSLIWPASSARFDRDTYTWRTLQCSLLGDSTPCSVKLPRWGTMRHGELSALTMPEEITNATGYGLWPTPAARDHKPTNTKEFLEAGRFVDQLNNRVQMVQNGWTTPAARDWKGHTITEKYPKGFTQSLANDVLMWPTPCASEARQGVQIRREGKKGTQQSLTTKVVLGEQAGGKLNPTWVEWLMAWPLGWTDLNPLEMGKFQSWQRSHGIFFVPTEPDWQEEFNHRAAILEYDAGFSRRDAEEEAMYFIAMQQYEWRLKHGQSHTD